MSGIVRNILNNHLSDLSINATVAWENVPFTPKPNENHLRVSYLPGTTRAAANHKNAMDFESGIYQIDVYVPQNQGTSSADSLASGIRAHFYRGIRLTDTSSRVVHVQQTPSVTSGTREGAYWRVRVTVPWFAYLPVVS